MRSAASSETCGCAKCCRSWVEAVAFRRFVSSRTPQLHRPITVPLSCVLDWGGWSQVVVQMSASVDQDRDQCWGEHEGHQREEPARWCGGRAQVGAGDAGAVGVE